MKNNKVLVVAISPPPYGGQALMVQSLIEARYDSIQLHHVRMAFSNSMASVGHVEPGKVMHMMAVVWSSVWKRFRHNIKILYYVPGGSNIAPVVRDIFILFFLRLFFKKIIFHFHAAGVSEVVERLPTGIRHLARFVYTKPDLAIYLSDRNPDKLYFNSKHSIILPNGLEDATGPYMPFDRMQGKFTTLLYVGVLQESKGVKIFIEALAALVKKGVKIKATLVGEFASPLFEKDIRSFCCANGLEGVVGFTGIKTGKEKWQCFAEADIFCFPSFFESESFGNVVVEAMMFELPVIATNWRGIPDIVDDQETGLLIPPKNSEALAQAAEALIHDIDLRINMGRRGREKYLERYQFPKFVQGIENAFNLLL